MKLKAGEIDEKVKKLSNRQFDARYPLQVKRKLAREREETESARSEEPSAPAEGEKDLRPVLRQALLDFAREVAGAEDRAEVIEVVTSVDEYVDRVLKQT